MSVINAYDLTFGFLDSTLFSSATFDVEENDRVGLIGANGTGKTTLFKLICGEYEPNSGSLFLSKNTKTGFAEQFACADSNKTVYDELMTVYAPLFRIESELEALHSEIERDPSPELIEKQSTLTEKFQSDGGLTFRSMGRSTLIGLGFGESDFNKSVRDLSGGQRTKLSLGKLLLSDANLILLDEPTNHLDIKSVEWLEDFLKKYNGTAVIISHDRYFLDKVTNKTMEIRHKKISIRKGNYSQYIKMRDEQILSDKRRFDNQMKEIKRIEGIIEQQKRFNQERNYITIASKEKQIERLKDDLPETDANIPVMKLDFSVNSESGNEVIIADSLEKSYDGKMLFKNVTLDIRKGERVFLIGPNGCGKSTLLKSLIGRVYPDKGYSKFGANVKPGYYDQEQRGLNLPKSVLQEVYDRFPNFTITQLRGYLAGFLFRGDDINKLMSELSGGERARVALLELSFSHPNLLILDEPTNHLDIESREVLEDALENYDGTMLCVSHDRYFINRLATKILAFDGTNIEPFEGNYDDYVNKVMSEQTAKEPKEKKVNEYQLRKERESAQRKRQTKIKKLEQSIADLDIQKEDIQNQLDESSSDYESILTLTSRLDEITKQQELLYEEWMNLSEEE
ncbi:MAG: ABC-F family ATP-binding cassette domain-containing protein [Oscillospiraceae bacterium]|nr:ABC-F family ATP-binding cassette domain-containing protein [Oscillospiraceae bacterium]MDD7355335.1 ABC-F family ATP-binding cassette domain-containing protein [Oscillospiraceae bacterium]